MMRHGMTARWRTPFLAAVLFIAGTSVVSSQDASQVASQDASQDAIPDETAAFEDALFGDTDGVVDGSAGTGPGGATAAGIATAGAAGPASSSRVARTEYLVGGTVAVRAAVATTTALDGYTANASAAGRLFGKVSLPEAGQLYTSWNVVHSLFQASAPETLSGASDPYTPDIELAELHYSFDIGKKLFVRLGNQLISWGPSRVWSPVDFINLEQEDAFATVDTRTGKPGLRLHVPFSRANVFAFADFDNLVTEVTTPGGSSASMVAGDPLDLVNLGGRVDFTAAAFEFGLTGYGGNGTRFKAGLDASGRLLGSTIYGEAALYPAYDELEQVLRASAGFSRTLGDLKTWTLAAEAMYNSTGDDLSGLSTTEYLALPSESRRPLYQGMWYGYASLAAAELVGPDVGATLSALVNFSEMSFRLTLSTSFSFPDAVPFSLSLALAGSTAGGDAVERTEFTRFAGNGALSLAASTRLDF